MITNLRELLDENFNLRHFIQHTTIDLLHDSNASKEDLIDAVMDGIKMWTAHMVEKIIDHSADSKETGKNAREQS